MSEKIYDAVVVGSGPNGLAAAITMAQSGRSVLLIEAKKTIGGGLRSADLTHTGCIHDICAAVHPLESPRHFFNSLETGFIRTGVAKPLSPLAHPLDDGTAVLLERSLMTTAENLGQDGAAITGLMRPLVRNWDKLLPDILSPLHFPKHPLALGRFGLTASQTAGLRDIQKLQNHESPGAVLPGLRRTQKCRLINPAAPPSDYCWERRDTPSAGRWRKADHSRLPKPCESILWKWVGSGDRPGSAFAGRITKIENCFYLT